MSKYPKDFKFERVCPGCKILIEYKTYQGYECAILRNSKCKKCGSGWSRGQTKQTNESIKKQSMAMSNTLKIKFNSGELKPWNIELTKETSDIIKMTAQNHTGFKHSEQTKRIISEHSKQRWESGVYNNQYSKSHNEFKKYQNTVHRLTKKIKHLIEGYDESIHGKMGKNGAYQIDHIVDIKYGFDNNMPPEEIAGLSNLQFITWEQNRKKGYYVNGKNKVSQSDSTVSGLSNENL